MSEVINPFVAIEDAQRYERFRPVYQNIPFEQLHKYLGKRVPRALDVACGTGHSTMALAKIAEQVAACDASAAMLSEAKKHSGIHFVQGQAEALPFVDSTFDLVNITMAFHWTDQERFLAEAYRVLGPGGRLSIDNHGFTGEMLGRPEFAAANKEFYSSNLPRASRRLAYPDEAQLQGSGFKFEREFICPHDLKMNLAAFVGFIMTQSNFLIMDPDKRAETVGKIESFYAPFFGSAEQTLRFAGTMKLYLR